MKQIRIKELPNRYFVTDKYYPSGNYEFVSIEETIGVWAHDKYLKKPEPIEIFGSKHIQLIGVNLHIWNHSDDDDDNRYRMGYSDNIDEQELLKEYKVTRLQYELVESLKKQNKDFFIYKIKEMK